MPDVRVEWLQGTTNWTDATSYVAGQVQISRGRMRDIDEFRAGTASFLLEDPERDFDPNDAGANAIGPRTQWRVILEAGADHLLLDGVSGTYASTPDHADLDITGDIDIRCKVALDDWTPANNQYLAAKSDNSASVSYGFSVRAGGALGFVWSPFGTNGGQILVTSTTVAPASNGGTLWVRVTLDVDNGGGAYEVKFYTSDDGEIWTQLGSTVSAAGATSMFSGTTPLRVGSYTGTLLPLAGKIYSVEIRNGIDGTIVANPDFTDDVAWSESSTSGSDSTGKTWTLNGNAGIVPTDHVIFRGFQNDREIDYGRAGSKIPNVEIQCVDAFTILAGQELDAISSAHGGELSGTRVSRVLDLAEVGFPAGLRDIDAGLTTMGATTFGTNALAYLQTVAKSESGAAFITRDGSLRFKQRNSIPTNVVTFSDDGAADAVDYTASPQRESLDLVYNRVRASGTSGSVQLAEDATSKDAYEVRTLDRTGLLMQDDSEAADLAAWLLGRFKDPETRFHTLPVEVHHQTDALQATLAQLELTDRVTVERTPPDGGAQVVQTAVVDGLAWTLDPRDDAIFLAVTVSAGLNQLPWVASDLLLSQAGITTRAGY